MTALKKDAILKAIRRAPEARNADIARELGIEAAYVSTVRQRHKAVVARAVRASAKSMGAKPPTPRAVAGPDCRLCKDRGWIINVYRERAPRPAFWFNRGPNGERPRICDCGLIGGDA
ncbi:hypothetical protein [Maritimibacter alexandrii]|uniref:hypothetical protein n=1 Tax=Maritimibacter alexandrii TaxID=2570355 RepID=UPI001F31871D|nr:hypothetical protein [Maritimibacter alexandrii]